MTSHGPLAASPPERLHALDAVRALALLLGVAFHATMSYLPGAQYLWIASDGDQTVVLSVLFYVVHLFRMTVFFVIAGFFGRMALERLGTMAFARDRFKRIVVPLLSAWPLVFTGIVAAVVWGAYVKNGGSFPKESPPGPAFTPSDFPLTHLWFLYVLSLLYLGALALRTLVARLDRKGLLRAGVDACMRALVKPWAPLLLAVPVAICLSTLPKWLPWFGIPTPDHSLYPNLAASVGFGVAFGFGWLLQRQPKLLELIAHFRWWNLGLAVAATIVCFVMVGLNPALKLSLDEGTKLAYAFSYGVASWAWSLTLIGLTLRFLSSYNATWRYLADASYWVYIVHLPLVMALQVAASQLAWPWWIEYPSLLAIAFALMLGSYHLMVRHSFIGATLNGRRVPRAAAPGRPQ